MFDINNHPDLRRLHTLLTAVPALRQQLAIALSTRIEELHAAQRSLLEQSPFSNSCSRFALRLGGGDPELTPTQNPRPLFADDVDIDPLLKSLQIIMVWPHDTYGPQHHHAKPVTFFLLTTLKVSEVSLNTIQVAIRISRDFTYHPHYVLHFSTLYKLKTIYLSRTAEQPNTLGLLSFDLMQSIHESDEIYCYARPVNAQESYASLHPEETTNIHFIVSSFFNGVDLENFLMTGQVLLHMNEHSLLKLLLSICHEVYAVNFKQYIVKDLKPSNILIDLRTLCIRLIDLEQAPLIHNTPLKDQNNTTLAYAAPIARAADADTEGASPRRKNISSSTAVTKIRPAVVQRAINFSLLAVASGDSPKLKRQSSSAAMCNPDDKELRKDTVLNTAYLLTNECRHDLHSLGMVFLQVLLPKHSFEFLIAQTEHRQGKVIFLNRHATFKELVEFYGLFKKTLKYHHKILNFSWHIPEWLFNLTLSMLQSEHNPDHEIISIAEVYSTLRDKYAELSKVKPEEVDHELQRYACDNTHNYKDISTATP